MAYLDSKNVAYFSTGRLPKLAPETDAGAADARHRALRLAGVPLARTNTRTRSSRPTRTLLNWNNKPAPEWGAASDNYSYGPMHRVQMYNGFTNKMTEAKDAGDHEQGRHAGLPRRRRSGRRSRKCWKRPRRRAHWRPRPTSVMTKWVKSGASRYGKERPKAAGRGGDRRGLHADRRSGPEPGARRTAAANSSSIDGIDNGPNSGGSSFGGGWYGYVYKDLRTAARRNGRRTVQPRLLRQRQPRNLQQIAVGGDADGAGRRRHRTGHEQPEEMESREGADRIPARRGITRKLKIPWTNRSTFQQVIEFTTHQEEDLEGPIE